jgi:YD repeat-containing protein
VCLTGGSAADLFHYDYQGLRISKDMGGQVLRYTYDDNSVLLETDNTESLALRVGKVFTAADAGVVVEGAGAESVIAPRLRWPKGAT